jgi:hypothetical protein
MGAYLTYLELSTGKDKRVIEFLIDARCKCSRIPQMTAEKANLSKKIPSSPKKKYSCVTFSATRGEPTPSTLTLVAEKSLTCPLPLREIRAWKKVVLFFVEEIVLSSQIYTQKVHN